MATTESRSLPKPVLGSHQPAGLAVLYFPECFATAATLHISSERMLMEPIRYNSLTVSETILLFVQQIKSGSTT